MYHPPHSPQMSRPVTPSGTRRSLDRRPGQSSLGASGAPKIISLTEWEANAPLEDEELGSIAVVRDACSSRPLPDKFLHEMEDIEEQSRSGTPVPRKLIANSLLQQALTDGVRSPSLSTRPSTPSPQVITTPQQFHSYFTTLTSSLSHSQDSLYRSHLAEISTYREACETLAKELQEAEIVVESMRDTLGWVEERGESLRIAGEGMMEEKAQLERQSANLRERLSYFTYLEQAQRVLHNPGEDLVLSEGFLGMVERLDQCLTYLGAHRDFRDAEIYLIRYQQCMTRSMTLIKLYFVNSLKALAADVTKRITEKGGLSETATLALIYTKFTSFAFPIRSLLSELEKRVSQNQSELGSLLDECHVAWVVVRKALVGVRVEREVKRMEPWQGGTGVVELTRSGCGYLKQTCMEEFNLFKQFFATGEDKLYSFLEGLCDYLYDYLRPRILHEPNLTILCEVCTVLQALMINDIDIEEPEDVNWNPNDTSASYFPDQTTPTKPPQLDRRSSYELEERIQPHRPLTRLHVAHLLRMVLQDAQTRLVFRSQAVVRSDVGSFVPSGDDLDYPGKIERASSHLSSDRGLAVSLDEEDDDDPSFFTLPSKETQETWYPTLRTTLWVLSCLHTYIDTAVFEDLAQESISICRASLSTASSLLSAKPTASSTDGQLFLVRHLLILKEMTASVDLVRRDRAANEERGVVAALSTLLANALYMVGASSLFGLSARRTSDATDAKADVDRELKRVCEDLIAHCASSAIGPATSFLNRCTLFLSTRTAGANQDLLSQDWATPAKVIEVHDAMKGSVERAVAGWIGQVKLYLQDEATVRVLLPPMQNSIMDGYKAFQDVVKSEYDSATSSLLMTPSALNAMLRRIENDALAVRE